MSTNVSVGRWRASVIARPNQLAVGPVVDDVHPRRIGALFVDEPLAHALANRDDGVGVAQQRAIQPIERAVHERIVEIVEQLRDFRKDVLAEEHESRARPPAPTAPGVR
jgi:hypothetical protein